MTQVGLVRSDLWGGPWFLRGKLWTCLNRKECPPRLKECSLLLDTNGTPTTLWSHVFRESYTNNILSVSYTQSTRLIVMMVIVIIIRDWGCKESQNISGLIIESKIFHLYYEWKGSCEWTGCKNGPVILSYKTDKLKVSLNPFTLRGKGRRRARDRPRLIQLFSMTGETEISQ